MQLVQPGQGTVDTRRTASQMDLDDPMWALTHQLATERLVVTSHAETEETVEVAHEALIQHWGRLRSWMEADRTFRVWQERLRYNMQQWVAQEQDDGTLLRGAPLAEAEGWLEQRGDDLTTIERDFIQASIDWQAQQIAEKEAMFVKFKQQYFIH